MVKVKKFSEWTAEDVKEILELISIWLEENGLKESSRYIQNFLVEFNRKVEILKKVNGGE